MERRLKENKTDYNIIFNGRLDIVQAAFFVIINPMLYNPFEQATKSSFRELVESGYVDFVFSAFPTQVQFDFNYKLAHINLFEPAG